MSDKPLPSLEDLAILEQALDERKVKNDRRKLKVELPPEIERRSGADRRDIPSE